MEVNNLTIGIGGEAGAGIIESGIILAKTALRHGLYAFVTNDYPSLIRGGHNYVSVRLNSQPLTSSSKGLDLLIALNEETIALHQHELRTGAGIIYDNEKITLNPAEGNTLNLYGLPLHRLAKETGGPDIIANTAALAAALALLNGDLKVLEKVLRDAFSHKGDEVVNINIKIANQAFREFKQNLGQTFGYTIQTQLHDRSRVLLNGNDAISLGALRAGVKFVSIYPMTPITSILEFLAAQDKNYNLVIKEPEDEIAAINMAIGASFAGVRALTASSGGGFCLMTEGISLAGMTEIPLVIVEGMRGGPSTGLPTKTEQADLRFVLHAGQGEFPRIVLSPGDPIECFQETFRAFNLAEKYQLPVIIITDKYLSGSYQILTLPDDQQWAIEFGPQPTQDDQATSFPRYKITDSGVSPRSLPGKINLINKSNSNEHDEFGMIRDDPQTRINMVKKRLRKMTALATELPEPVLYGDKDADFTIIGWGSTKGPILEAISRLAEEGIKVNFLHLLYLLPFPAFTVASALDKAKLTLIVENNATGQADGYIREMTGRRITHRLLRYDGMPFTPEDIIHQVKKIIQPAAPPPQVESGGEQS